MKKIKIYLTVLLVTATVSCTKNFQSINTNPGAFITAEPDAVLPGVFVNTINKFALTNINTLWEYTHIVDPSGRYNPASEGNVWTNSYVTVLGNTKALKNLYAGNPGYANRMAVNDIWECYVFFYLVGSYGPIPYTHMGDTSSPVVMYDSENTIYTSLLSRLKADATQLLNPGIDKFTTDPIYGGNFTLWAKFANSLRLRIALTVQVNLPALAVSNITDIMSSESTLISSEADDPKLSYGTASGSQSPYYTNFGNGTSFQTGAYPVMSETAWTWFRTYSDPRMAVYFQPSLTPLTITDTLTSTTDAFHHIVTYPIPYAGQSTVTNLLPGWSLVNAVSDPHGDLPFSIPSNAQTNLSQIATIVAGGAGVSGSPQTASRPFYIINYADVCFMKAEAMTIPGVVSSSGGTASSFYYAGINANFAFWGLTQAQANTYQQQQGIQWGTAATGFNSSIGLYRTNLATTDNLKRIWVQQWLNYFPDDAFEAWVLLRRIQGTTQAIVTPPSSNPGATAGLSTSGYESLPDRYPYPVVNESQVNPVGYAAGVQLLSNKQDLINTPLAFEAPYTPTNWLLVHPFWDISFVQKYYGTTIQSVTAAGKTYNQTSQY